MPASSSAGTSSRRRLRSRRERALPRGRGFRRRGLRLELRGAEEARGCLEREWASGRNRRVRRHPLSSPTGALRRSRVFPLSRARSLAFDGRSPETRRCSGDRDLQPALPREAPGLSRGVLPRGGRAPCRLRRYSPDRALPGAPVRASRLSTSVPMIHSGPTRSWRRFSKNAGAFFS